MEHSNFTFLVSDDDDVCFEFAFLRHNWDQRGFRAYHKHRMYEMHIAEQGGIRILLEGKEYRLREGALFLIPPGKIHLIIPEENAVRRGIRFSFSRNRMKEGWMYSYLCSAFQSDTDCFSLDSMNPCCSDICRTLNRFYNGASDFITAQSLKTALLSIADTIKPIPDISGIRETTEDSIRTVQLEEFLNENYMRHIPLSEVAEMFHLSEKQTERMLLRLFHAPLHVLIGEKRLTVAKYLLLRTDLSIGEIAASAGFGNISYFYRRFRAATGKTPLAYRNDP